MSERGAVRVDVPDSSESGKPMLNPVPEDGREEPRVIELGWARQVGEARKRQEHWTEVELVVEMWERVARSWNNDTLMRLARYARLEAEIEREIERKAR